VDEIKKYRLYVRTQPSDLFESGYAFIDGSGSYFEYPQSDMYVPIILEKTSNMIGYVDVRVHNPSESIQRQEINPFFYEYSIFDSINRIKPNSGTDLSSSMVDSIRSMFQRLSGSTDQQIRDWFDYEGINSLPWISESGVTVSIDDLTTSNIDLNTLSSRARIHEIDIYTINANT
jgi:hypothetical protein